MWILALITLEISTGVIILALFFDHKLFSQIQQKIHDLENLKTTGVEVLDLTEKHVKIGMAGSPRKQEDKSFNKSLLENAYHSHEELFTAHHKSTKTCTLPLEFLKPSAQKLPESTKFLIPVLKWGPNNQMMGFFEALSVAKSANRRLVLPPFYFHEKTQKHTKPSVPGELRVNIDAIPELVTLEEYKSFCGSDLDAVFLAIEKDVFSKNSPDRSGVMIQRTRLFQQITGVQILNNKTLDLRHDLEKFPAKFTPDVRLNWRGYFRKAEDKRCAALILPYRSIKAFANEKGSAEAYGFSKLVEKIKTDFEASYGKIKLGLHWRFNQGDWSNRCDEKNPRSQLAECQILSKGFDKKHLANNLMIDSEEDDFIYLASPPSERKFIGEIAAFTVGRQVLTGEVLEEFISARFDGCDWFEDYLDEVISLVEQALLASGKYFIPWSTSSWSARIIDVRRADRRSSQSPHFANVLEFLSKNK